MEAVVKSLLAVALVFLIASPVGAAIISADADGFSDGSDISTAFAGMTLSSVGGYPGLDGLVYAWGDGLASTGTSVFANNLSFQRQWYANLIDGFAFRADFDQPADYVAIDIIGDDYSGDVGVLHAYNAADVLLESVTTDALDYGEVFTAQISRGSFDIAYIIAGGAVSTEDAVHLDNLTANVVPEPATLCLFALGGLFLTRRRRMLA
jgi:hypothetical protein